VRMAGDAVPKGKSWVGGTPRVPPGFAWPYSEGNPMVFVAQFNLAEVTATGAAMGLPKAGHLYFFYDPLSLAGDSPPAFVFHSTVAAEKLLPVATPDDMPEEEVKPVSFMECTSALHLNWFLDDSEKPLTAKEKDLRRKYEEYRGSAPDHRLGGYNAMLYEMASGLESQHLELEGAMGWKGTPLDEIDDDMEVSEAFNKHAMSNWSVLLQLDSDEDAGVVWADGGSLLFVIRNDELKRGDFSRVGMEVMVS
ncbi:MAG: YwqG family protein, partial [Roseimicrobium sp.]